MAKLNFKFDPQLERDLRAFAAESGENMSVVVRQAIRSHIRKAKATA